jgi:hyperosmotically inducible periplasmic protein
MKSIRLGSLLIVAYVCCATAPAVAQSSSPDSSASSVSSSTGVSSKSGAETSSAPAASDHELAKRVRRALSRSGMVMVDITVRAKNGVVTLIGSVPTDSLVQHARAVTSAVDGVASVDNRLIVRIDPRLLNGQSAGTGIPGKPITSARKSGASEQ